MSYGTFKIFDAHFHIIDPRFPLTQNNGYLPDAFTCEDHLGLSGAGFKTLLRLAERGVHIKATGFGRVDFDVTTALNDIYNTNKDALMFGTDLPSTRAPRPYQDSDLALVLDTLGKERATKVLYENAVSFYARHNRGVIQ